MESTFTPAATRTGGWIDSHRFAFLVVWVTQFVASLLTLSLPPFFALFMPQAFPGSHPGFAAAVFAAPLAAGAWAAPLWGRLGDRFGRVPLAIRAHLGLAIAAFWASTADSAGEFLFALTLQGALGGTYAANRAILLERARNSAERSEVLRRFESAPRLAMVIGPLTAAFLGASALSPSLFRWFVPLSIGCALLLMTLPTTRRPAAVSALSTGAATGGDPAETPARRELRLPKLSLFALYWSGAILAPYFVAWTQLRAPGSPLPVSTLFHLLPNLAFLMAAFIPIRSVRLPGRAPLTFGLAAQAVAVLALFFCETPATLFLARAAYSALFILNWQTVHDRIARLLSSATLGKGTGELDAIQRWSALAGAATAALLWPALPTQAALPLAVGALGLAAAAGVWMMERRTHVAT